MVKKNVIDLMAAAAKNKKLVEEFKAATSATNLQKRWSEVKPGYFVSMEDCVKLFKERKKILSGLYTADSGIY